MNAATLVPNPLEAAVKGVLDTITDSGTRAIVALAITAALDAQRKVLDAHAQQIVERNTVLERWVISAVTIALEAKHATDDLTRVRKQRALAEFCGGAP